MRIIRIIKCNKKEALMILGIIVVVSVIAVLNFNKISKNKDKESGVVIVTVADNGKDSSGSKNTGKEETEKNSEEEMKVTDSIVEKVGSIKGNWSTLDGDTFYFGEDGKFIIKMVGADKLNGEYVEESGVVKLVKIGSEVEIKIISNDVVGGKVNITIDISGLQYELYPSDPLYIKEPIDDKELDSIAEKVYESINNSDYSESWDSGQDTDLVYEETTIG